MSEQERFEWYLSQESDHKPVIAEPEMLIDEDWRLGWE